MTIRDSHTYDNLLLLKDAGSVTATGACTVAGSPRVLDLGIGHVHAQVVIDNSVFDFTTGDESYRFSLQGCTAVGFGSGVVELGSITITASGRNELFFGNEQGGTVYQFVRGYLTLGGTTPIINCTAFIAMMN